MLFRSSDLKAIVAGERTLAFRRWKRPTARAGGTVKTQMGLVGIDAVEAIDPATATEAEARAAGYQDLAALNAMFDSQDGTCYRIRLHFAGPDTRPQPGDDPDITDEEWRALDGRLAKLDARSATGPWTAATLRIIADNPGKVARLLAAELGRERDAFKEDVRKLKALGLTVSLEVGYRLSPRGDTYLNG
jgi:hypothetical protein